MTIYTSGPNIIAHFGNCSQPIFCLTPALAAEAYKGAHAGIIDVTDDLRVALIRTTSDKSGAKIWAVVGESDGVNCEFGFVGSAEDWWEDSFDADADQVAE